jgi:U3 small nucleolar RNA-associated protein 21
MEFSSPVLSITMSPTANHLCIALADKNGIYVYVDRSLYETIHFSKEPTEPTVIQDSAILTTDVTTIGTEDEDDENEGEIDQMSPENTEALESSTQLKESRAQKDSAITLSGLPKAYWTTLFRLEDIKARNRPKMPAKAAEKAPFFLPTVVREGATPSFPTPQEYQTLQATVSGHQNKKSKLVHENEDQGNSNDDDGLAYAWTDEGDVDEENLTTRVSQPSSRILKSKVELPR